MAFTKIIVVINLLFIIQQALSQNIGINGTGANAHSSALLDVDAVATPSLGILVPRIALQAINLASPVGSPATSLLLYNTATASTGTNAVSPGYYYWDATKWVRFAYSASGNSAFNWNTLGNAGTVAGINFLGTTDAQDLVFKTNSTENMRILTANGNVGINTVNPSTAKLVVTSTSNTFDGITANHTSGSVGSVYHAVRGEVNNSAYNIATAYLAYHNSSNATYAVYGIGGNYAGVFLNKTYIGNLQPTATINVADLEVSNITPGTNAPSLMLRQSTALTVANSDMAHLNFGDNNLAGAQASIRAARDLASSGITDLPTNLTFHTIADGTAALLERMRIDNSGNVGIGTASPTEKLTIENGNIQLGEALGAVGLGRKLNFSNAFNQSDDIYFQRENISSDVSNLQLMLGDNLGGDDKFLIKTTASTTPLLTVVNNGNIGINTAIAPTEKLEVQGSVKIVDGTQGLNKVLTSDVNGKASWKQPSGGYRQKYTLQGAQTYPNSTSTLMNFPTVSIPYTGFYLINFKSFFYVPIASEYSYYVEIRINGVLYSTDETYTYCDANNYLNQTDVYTLQANAGDVITLNLIPVVGAVALDATPGTFTRVRFDLLFLGN